MKSKVSTKIMFFVWFLSLFSHILFGQERSTYDNALFKIQTTAKDYTFLLSENARSAQNITLPIFGTDKTFMVKENNVLEEDFKRQYPLLKTFDVYDESSNKVIGAMTLSDEALYVTLFYGGTIISYFPDFSSGQTWVEYGLSDVLRNNNVRCTQEEFDLRNLKRTGAKGMRFLPPIGSVGYTYRVAVAVTGEYYVANGNTDSQVRTSVSNTVNAMNFIFRNEIAAGLSISGSRINLSSKDPNTDVWIPDNLGGLGRTTQAGIQIPLLISPNSFDVGHVFHTHQDGDGWSNGGLAQLNSVCDNQQASNGRLNKASGWSGGYSNQGNGWISLATHEFAHQFGATHTFNGEGDSCQDNISSNTAVEIGSGTTIMSYNGLCENAQNIPSSGSLDNYFHVISLQQMGEYTLNDDGSTCGNPTPTNKVFPIIEAAPCVQSYSIPRGTPFYVEGRIIGNDSPDITYCWEQTDEDGPGQTPTQGFIGTNASNSTTAPLFRSYPPTKVPFRYFPNLISIVSGGNSSFEVLPNVARTIRLNLTVRDNDPTYGGVVNDEISINVNSTGPLTVTSPNTNTVFNLGETYNITWNTNGSNSLCNNVRIRLSFDGGKTFNYTIAENVSYSSGTFAWTLPNFILSTSMARVMIECMDCDYFKFFDISNTNFFIESSCTLSNSFVCPTSDGSFLQNAPELDLNMEPILGEQVNSVVYTPPTSGPTMLLTVHANNTDFTGCRTLGDIRYETMRFKTIESGVYNFDVRRDNGFAFISIFEAENFNFNNPCPRFVGSSAAWSGMGSSVSARTSMSVSLDACTEYIMIFYNFNATNRQVFVDNITGPGPIVRLTTPLSSEVGYFIAVDETSGIVIDSSLTADFRDIIPGTYRIYAVTSREEFIPMDPIGMTLNEWQINNCIGLSPNYRAIEVISSCVITSVLPQTQTACVPGPNTYTQSLEITYDRQPTTGFLNVNGIEYPITGSPQVVILEDLDSDGQPVDIIAFFTEKPECRYEATGIFTAPQNCCPIMLELGDDREECVGTTIELDAGSDGQTYSWSRNGNVISGQTSNKLSVNTSGEYFVEVTHATGCTKQDKINIRFNPLPVISLPVEHRVCAGDNVIIEAIVQNAQEFQWSLDGVVLPTETTNTIITSQPGLYRLEAISEFGCRDFGVSTLFEDSVPQVDLGTDIEECEGESVILDAGSEGIQYQWYFNSNLIAGQELSTYTPMGSGQYSVIVTNEANCQNSDDIAVRFFSSPILSSIEDTVNICQGEQATFDITASDFITLQWYFNDNVISNATTGVLQASNTGQYSLIASNSIGCETRRDVQLEVRSLPNINFDDTNLITACNGSTVMLDAGTDGVVYSWTVNGAPLASTASTLSVTTSGLYAVDVTTAFGCTDTDAIEVNFVPGPSLELGRDTSICDGDVLFITAVTDGQSIQWLKDGQLINNATAFTLSVNEGGVYEARVMGGMPVCTVTDFVEVSINPLPVINLGQDINLCAGETTTLNIPSSFDMYQWTRNGTPISSDPNIDITEAGTYQAIVTNSFGCQGGDAITIAYFNNPTLNIDDSYDLCEGTTLTIDSQSDGTVFEWTLDGNVLSGQTTRSIEILESGIYTCEASNQAECTNAMTFEVVSRPAPIVDLGLDTTLCPGVSIDFDLSTYTSVMWSDGFLGAVRSISSGQATMPSTIALSVQVENQFECEATDDITINIRPAISASLVADAPGVCNGEPVILTAGGGLFYQWSGPQGTIVSQSNNSATVAPTSTSIYSVVVSDDCPNNEDRAEIQIEVFEPTNISAGNDTCAIKGRRFKLNATGGLTYSWTPNSAFVGSATGPNPEVIIEEETTFTVTITDSNGCIFIDDVTICIIEDPLALFQPVSMITPNGDGKNDDLYFLGLEAFPENTLQVFNRWGNLIFEAEGYQTKGALFDGTRNGELLPPDVYYYILRFEDQTIKSSLTILRQ